MAYNMAKRKSQYCRHNPQALGKTEVQQSAASISENLLHMTSHSCEENLMGTLQKTSTDMLGLHPSGNVWH